MAWYPCFGYGRRKRCFECCWTVRAKYTNGVTIFWREFKILIYCCDNWNVRYLAVDRELNEIWTPCQTSGMTFKHLKWYMNTTRSNMYISVQIIETWEINYIILRLFVIQVSNFRKCRWNAAATFQICRWSYENDLHKGNTRRRANLAKMKGLLLFARSNNGYFTCTVLYLLSISKRSALVYANWLMILEVKWFHVYVLMISEQWSCSPEGSDVNSSR